jgi:hypothetical protein
MHGTFRDMFKRHRSDPDPTVVTALRDRLDSIALTARAESAAFDTGLVRGRLAGSATVGLRDRLGRQTLSTPRT